MYPPPAALSDAVFSTPVRLVGGPAPPAPAPPQPDPRTRKARVDLEYLAGGDRWGTLGGYLRSLPPWIDSLTFEFGPDLYDRMQLDDQVSSSLRALVFSVLSDDLVLRPGVDKEKDPDFAAAKDVLGFMERATWEGRGGTDEWLYAMAKGALGGGNRVSETVLRTEESGRDAGKMTLDRLAVKPRRSFAFVVDHFNRLVGIGGVIPGQYGSPAPYGTTSSPDSPPPPNLLPREKFCVLPWDPPDGDPRGSALLRCVYEPWWAKLQAARDWLANLAQFGSPSLVATTAPGADSSAATDGYGNPTPDGVVLTPEQDLLNQALAFRNGTVIVLPNGATLDALQTSNAGKAFAEKVDASDRAIAQGILLAMRAVMQSRFGSRADAEQGQDVAGLQTRFMKRWLARMVTEDLLRYIYRVNYGPNADPRLCPYASLSPVEHQDLGASLVAVSGAWKNGLIKNSQLPWVYEQFGMPPATPEELAAGAPPQAPGAPPGGSGAEPGGGQPPPGPQQPPQAPFAFEPAGPEPEVGFAGGPPGRWVTHEGRHIFIREGKALPPGAVEAVSARAAGKAPKALSGGGAAGPAKAAKVPARTPAAAHPLGGHPLAGKTRAEQYAALDQAGSVRAPSNDPWGLARGPLPAGAARARAAVVAAVAREQAKNSFVRPSVSDLYPEARAAAPGLTLHEFQRVLVHMQRAGTIRLDPYTAAVATHPEPEALIPLDRDKKFYVDKGKHFTAAAPFAFDPGQPRVPAGSPEGGEWGPGGASLEDVAESAHAYVRDNGPSRRGELAGHLRDEHGLGKPHALAAVDALHAAGYLTREPGAYDDRPVYDRGRAPGEGTGGSHARAIDIHGDLEARPAAGLFAAPGRAAVEDKALALLRSAGVRQASLTFRPAKGLTVVHDRRGIRADVAAYEDGRGLGVVVSEVVIGGRARRAVIMPDTPPDVAEYRLRKVLRLPVPRALRARLESAGGLPDAGFSWQDQPRVPAGSPEGGEWGTGGGGTAVADKPAPKKPRVDVGLTDREEAAVAKILKGPLKIKGGLTPEQLAALGGAPDGGQATIRPGEDKKSLAIHVSNDFTAIRHLRRLGSGELIMENELIHVKESEQGKGLGTDAFARQVDAARALGVGSIRCHAAREGGFNGYYTWARLGYDQSFEDLEDQGDGGLADRARAAFPGAESVLEVMASPEGRAWWKENGTDLHRAKFDLVDGSKSMAVFATYRAEQAAAAPAREEARRAGARAAEAAASEHRGKPFYELEALPRGQQDLLKVWYTQAGGRIPNANMFPIYERLNGREPEFNEARSRWE